jgi:hypothetical protein
MGNRSATFCVQGARVAGIRVLKEKHLKIEADINGKIVDAILIFYSWFLKVILYQHITRCKKSLGTTVAAL